MQSNKSQKDETVDFPPVNNNAITLTKLKQMGGVFHAPALAERPCIVQYSVDSVKGRCGS